MPEREIHKIHPHPHESTRARAGAPPEPGARAPSGFAELTALSNFSFLEGASHPEEMVERAAALGLDAIAIADRHSMAGVVRAHVAAKQHGLPLVVGTRCAFALVDRLDAAQHPAVAAELPPHEPRAPHEPTHLELVLLAQDRGGYARLCRLLTLGKRRAGWTGSLAGSVAGLDAGVERAEEVRDASACHLWLHDLLDASVQSLGGPEPGESTGGVPEAERPLAPTALPGVHAVVLPPRGYGAMSQRVLEALRWLRGVFDADRLSLALWSHGEPDDELRLLQSEWLADEVGVPLVAANDPHCHDPARQPLQDALVAVRAGCSLQELRAAMWREPFELAQGRPPLRDRLFLGDARHLKSRAQLEHALARVPPARRAQAFARSAEIARRCAGFSLDQLRYRYPREVVPPGRTPMQHLRALVEEGALGRWPQGVPARVRAQLEHEFSIVGDLDYACYFLTVHSIVAFARSRGILCQGRGAAANSAICYCLGITAVDPTRVEMLFERFISRERDEPPDIDVDFEHERREEVIQFIYRTYGRSRAALCAEVVSYRSRSAIRDVGKALGLEQRLVDALAGGVDWWNEALGMDGAPAGVREASLARARETGLDPDDPRLVRLFALASQLRGFPRHLSQHVGGFIITEDPLCELVPVRNATMDRRTIVEWDKDDIEAMGMLKVDVLALGMLTAVRKALAFDPWPAFHEVPAEDPAVYDMVSRADTVGVFQIESRAQMSMLPRLRPRCYYDLVIEVALVRPGPIQGDMVHPYLRRRNGEEPAEYPNADIERVLGRTLGVPLFQEQAMALAVIAAGFTPGQADELRRAIAAWKRRGNQIVRFGEMLEAGMLARGYTRLFAQQVFRQIQGFSGYGFPESHAASFALLVYVSAWLKRHRPEAFLAGLLNSQPMGFYAPAQLVRDAREHGVEVRPTDVHASAWDCTLEPCAAARAVRLGLRMVSGLAQADGERIAAAVAAAPAPFASVESLWRASGCSLGALRRLAAADAFGSMGLSRQQALWQIRALRDLDAPVLDEAAHEGATLFDMAPQPLPPVPRLREVAADYASTGLSLKDHPMRFLRRSLERRGAVVCAQLRAIGEAAERAGEARAPRAPRATVAGLVLCRQRPATAGGIVFMTLEDETGVANLVVHPRVYEEHRRTARHAVALLVQGRVEHRSGVTHLIARRLVDLTQALGRAGSPLASQSRDFH
ncbi:MAG: error-prone DNA polymerase [Phycisphaerales bacterium]